MCIIVLFLFTVYRDKLLTDSKPSGPNLKPPPETSDAIAIAVKQGTDDQGPPSVIAGGRGRVAEQILEIAFSQGIKVREDADLAQMLSVVDVESEIPLEAFAAVAEILTYVYEANNALDPEDEMATNQSTEMQKQKIAEDMINQWSKDTEPGHE